ncbi:helix-turn-helix domain-containing protein [Jatrophihabitans sp. YIM 134969]
MGAPAPVDVDRFTTAGLPAATRVRRWEAWNAAALISLRVGNDDLDAAQVNHRLGPLRLARVRTSAHEVERSAADVASSPTAALTFVLPLGATGRFRSGPRELTAGRGTLLVFDADRPFTRTFPAGVDEVVLTVPRASGVAWPEPVHLDVDGRVDPLAAALARALTATDQPWRLHPLAGALVARVAQRPVGPVRVGLARAYVAWHLADPSLSAATIAAAVGVSERQLSREFAAADGSVPREILEQRLQRARGLLEREPALPLAAVVGRVGLRSTSYFTRRFTERFGTTPGRWRAGCSIPPTPSG